MKFEQLREQVIRTLSGPPLKQETVIRACHALSLELLSGVHDTQIAMAFHSEIKEEAVSQKIREAARLLSRQYLEARITLELGEPDGSRPLPSLAIRRLPLGVLFHIGAGNMEALPAFSVIEGLLAGNINILKLPEADLWLSRAVLRRLAEIEPAIRPYVYVFGFPSADTGRIKRLASLADAVVIWGGDEAVSAVRRLVKPSCRIIEWGHKISFAYVTEQGIRQEDLECLANHMLDTDQTLCSSCQGIYLDTDDEKTTDNFCRAFSRILEAQAVKRPLKDMGLRARNTLRVCNSSLEAAGYRQKTVYSGEYTCVTWEKSPKLMTSLMFGNCWVKNLTRTSALTVLREDSGYLQTVVLLCGEEEREELSGLLYRAGAVQIRRPQSPESQGFPLPHDGQYPLRRYSKYVTFF